jgi:hypothetical protein
MDVEEFFDHLYSHYYVHFPCYAMLREKDSRLASESARDGTRSLVLLTDDDLVGRYQAQRPGRYLPVMLPTPGHLYRFLGELPDGFTHVAFDPAVRFHRRYPLAVIRDGLAFATQAG